MGGDFPKGSQLVTDRAVPLPTQLCPSGTLWSLGPTQWAQLPVLQTFPRDKTAAPALLQGGKKPLVDATPMRHARHP